jgi:hypothetical protein
MNQTYPRRVGAEPLAPRAVSLRNNCLGALARSNARPVPADPDLANLPSDVGVREAWDWWVTRTTPPSVAVVPEVIAKPRRRRSPITIAILTLFATTAWLLWTPSALWG